MSENIFKEQYENLNKKQREAVDTIDGPVMVIAGPGTGKTTILTLRIANILKQTDTPPSGILAITFTDAGVKAMRLKLRAIIGNRADEVKICTFHGLASSVISENSEHFMHLEKCSQLTDIEAESMIRKLLEKNEYADLRPYGNPDFYVSKIISGISDCKRESFTPEMLKSFIKEEMKRIKSDDESYSTRGKTKGELKAEFKKVIEKCEKTIVFSDLYKDYENQKKIEKKIDFDDLISELSMALNRDELLLRILQERFLYILVDEHQDTNNSQNSIILKLADFFDTPNVFIVGDEKQAIYRFQGASVENFLKFKETWKGMKLIQLNENYRSHQAILDASFSMIENNYVDDSYKDLRVKLKSSNQDKPRPIELVSAGNVESMENYLVESLKRLSFEEPQANIAIITKTNKDLERAIRLLEKNSIPVSSERSVDIFNHPVGSLFFDLIDFLHDQTKTDSLARVISVHLFGLNFEKSVAILKNLKSGNLTDLKEITGLNSLIKKQSEESPINFIIEVSEISGLINLSTIEPAYTEVWRGIVNLSEDLVRDGKITDSKELLKRLLAYRSSAETRSIKISVGTPDLKIQAMTAHGSKGLEFDYVFIPYATEDSWIGRNWGSFFMLPDSRSKNETEDVRRLFYVALTRARKHVVVMYGEEEFGEVILPLRFIDELSSEFISKTQIAKASPANISNRKIEKWNAHEQKIIDFAKSTLLSKGLSVTALNHFINCPSAFLYQSILKIPQAPAASAEKGNAMHLAISNIWKSKNRTAKNISKIFSDTLESYFDQSLLPSFEKKAVLNDLMTDLPAISSELEPHFALQGDVFSETWSETTFSHNHAGNSISIPIHGKLDAVISNGNSVSVFDYKTKQSMSENEILGKTKNSDGGYFRQLIFYKILLNADSRFADKQINPSLVFVVPNNKGECPTISLPITDSDMENVFANIKALIEGVWSGEFLTNYCDDKKCEWCRLKKVISITD